MTVVCQQRLNGSEHYTPSPPPSNHSECVSLDNHYYSFPSAICLFVFEWPELFQLKFAHLFCGSRMEQWIYRLARAYTLRSSVAVVSVPQCRGPQYLPTTIQHES